MKVFLRWIVMIHLSYAFTPLAIHRQPRAPFLCQPHIRPAK
jgi:hypothetical protein